MNRCQIRKSSKGMEKCVELEEELRQLKDQMDQTHHWPRPIKVNLKRIPRMEKENPWKETQGKEG